MSSWLTARSFIYSVRKDLTGFAIAALIAWKLIVRNAIKIAEIPAAINTPVPIFILYAKSFNHSCMAHQVTGTEIINAMPTSNKNSFDTSNNTCCTEAPNTFRIPISFVRCSITNAESPNKPRLAIMIAKMANAENICCVRCSLA